jgi:uncharacterized protein (TIGR00255 family)
VNGRGLDLRMRLAPGFEGLEPRVREEAGKRIARGSLTVNLNVKRRDGGAEIRLNPTALAQVLTALEAVKSLTPTAPPRAEALLAIRGVLEVVEPQESEAEAQALAAAMIESLRTGLDAMVDARAEEGRRLGAIVEDQLATIAALVARVAASPARTPQAMRQRIEEQIARLFEQETRLDEARLYQEAALLATRADIDEELKRLTAHIAGARELLAAGAGAGRRLDFLAQEFNREANTLCSKSNDTDITRAGLELKAVIDQMREQVQNIE